ncbi:hypothetical protein J3Q64DRAFT_1722460 [Phycomyces blakesleeanus]|uniref:Uncharacterized protein n=1 Tax=Phycomyces blakesleeanus TaxID=4837 RepID=A0ABR3BAH0_PHYBL
MVIFYDLTLISVTEYIQQSHLNYRAINSICRSYVIRLFSIDEFAVFNMFNKTVDCVLIPFQSAPNYDPHVGATPVIRTGAYNKTRWVFIIFRTETALLINLALHGLLPILISTLIFLKRICAPNYDPHVGATPVIRTGAYNKTRWVFIIFRTETALLINLALHGLFPAMLSAYSFFSGS